MFASSVTLPDGNKINTISFSCSIEFEFSFNCYDDFKRVVSTTLTPMVHVLSELFWNSRCCPTLDGNVENTDERPWEHYARNLNAFMESDGEDSIVYAIPLLQWSCAAYLAAVATEHHVCAEPDFLITILLALYGYFALSATSELRDARNRWDELRNSTEAFIARRTGAGWIYPQGKHYPVIVPWPAAFGVDMGDESEVLARVLKVVSKVSLRDGAVKCDIRDAEIRIVNVKAQMETLMKSLFDAYWFHKQFDMTFSNDPKIPILNFCGDVDNDGVQIYTISSGGPRWQEDESLYC